MQVPRERVLLAKYLDSGGQGWPPLDKSNSFSGCFSDRGAQPLAELSLAERSEAPARSAVPREARRRRRRRRRPSEARRDPELREGFKRKLEATNLGATQMPRPDADSSFPGSALPRVRLCRLSEPRRAYVHLWMTPSEEREKLVLARWSQTEQRRCGIVTISVHDCLYA